MPGERANVVWDVRSFAQVDSTNAVAIDLARHGAPEGVVVVAEHQTAGRGRLGRRWEAPPGSSLLVSILLRPGPAVPPERAQLLTAAVALAAADACAEVAGFRPALKWPNDLVVEGPDGVRKLAGVLAEADLVDGTLVAVVVGLGLNANWPTDLPPELAGIAVAANHLAGREVDRAALLGSLLAGLADSYRRLRDPDGWREVAAEFRRRCTTVGQPVRVQIGAETLVGQAAALSDEGLLGVQLEDGLRWVAAGDVHHLRPTS